MHPDEMAWANAMRLVAKKRVTGITERNRIMARSLQCISIMSLPLIQGAPSVFTNAMHR
jgi:hypothetical protein